MKTAPMIICTDMTSCKIRKEKIDANKASMDKIRLAVFAVVNFWA